VKGVDHIRFFVTVHTLIVAHTPPHVDVSSIENNGADPDVSLAPRALSMSDLGNGGNIAACSRI
jgi:hypothetical protein